MRAAAMLVAVLVLGPAAARLQTPQAVEIRGHRQSLFIYGSPRGDPVIVSSGDGGWIHVGPHLAQALSGKGFFVVGVDVKAYLESFTERHSTLQVEQEPGDYHVLTDFAQKATGKKPILVGISEGAGLSLLAATDPRTKEDILGVVAVGLPEMNEPAWRWKDAVIYLTHGVPDEPTFSTTSIIGQVAPVPVAAIHSTHDEYVPLDALQRILAGAGEPKRLWVVPAANHRFSDNLDGLDKALLEAIAWVREHRRG